MAKSIAEQKAELAKKLADLDRQEKEQREKQERIAGRVVMQAAESDPTFNSQLHALLDKHLTGKRDRAAFSLPPKVSSTPVAYANG